MHNRLLVPPILNEANPVQKSFEVYKKPDGNTIFTSSSGIWGKRFYWKYWEIYVHPQQGMPSRSDWEGIRRPDTPTSAEPLGVYVFNWIRSLMSYPPPSLGRGSSILLELTNLCHVPMSERPALPTMLWPTRGTQPHYAFSIDLLNVIISPLLCVKKDRILQIAKLATLS